MKKFFVSFLVIVVCLTIFLQSGVASQFVNEASIKKLLLYVEFGKEKDQISHSSYTSDSLMCCAESFMIDENRNICILDSISRTIDVYNANGEYVNEIVFECTNPGDTPILLSKCNNEFAILVRKASNDIAADALYYIVVANDYTSTIYDALIKQPLPRPAYIVFAENRVEVMCQNSSIYTYSLSRDTCSTTISKNDKNKIELNINDLNYCSASGNRIAVNTHGDVSSASLIGYDVNENLYFAEIYTPYNAVYGLAEMRISKYDNESNEISYAIIDDWSENATLPFKDVFVSGDGDVYYMSVTELGIYIYHVTLGTSDISGLCAKYNTKALQFYNNQSNTAQTRTSMNLKRDNVKSRAVAMANLTWTVKDSHRTAPTGNTEVVVPPHIVNATVGSTLTGIPYCWGGYNGYDTIGQKTRFQDIVLQNNQTAGNINCTGGHKSGTIGLDCSGFVASAYNLGLTSKPSAAQLISNYGTSVTLTELKSMDMIGRGGVHIMLYDSHFYRDGVCYINVYDCATRDEHNNHINKVSYRTISKAYADRKQFGYYTPWSTTCSYGNTWSHTSSYHYKNCLDCGYQLREEHTWRIVGSQTKCSVCGRTQTNSGGGLT